VEKLAALHSDLFKVADVLLRHVKVEEGKPSVLRFV